MLLSSFVQNEPLATLEKWEKPCQKLKEWAASCPSHFKTISSLGSITLDDLSRMPETKKSLDLMLEKLKEFPIEGMEELLDRRLKKPLKIAKLNCNKLLNEVEHSGLEDNKKYLENLLSKTSSIANGIDKEFMTFIFEVQLELIKKVKWTSGNKKELEHTFSNLHELAKHKKSYCRPEYEPGTPEFVECLGIRILNAKLGILKRELHAKIAGFVEQPHIDGDGFMTFSHNFKNEWNKIKQQMDQVNNNDIASTMRLYRKELNDLAKTAMEKTDLLKAIITEKLDQLITKCQNSSGKINEEEASNQLVATKEKGLFKNAMKQLLKPFKSDQKKQKEEAKKKEIYAMKNIINDSGMFDGAAYKLLVRFEHEELDTDDFCAELETAVEEDKQMILQAYQTAGQRVASNEVMGM
uniref:Uncharacterized protein n=1 Tax=Globodera rostochiensis TaxID=31243 RepID=A0A914HK93_GLORO